MGNVRISASVGKGGKNVFGDVLVVQILLNKFIVPGSLKLPVLMQDGQGGPKTTKAIETFQLQIAGLSKADGKVDPNGKTLKALNGPLPSVQGSKSPPPGAKPVTWVLDDTQEWRIRNTWGRDVLDWVLIPPPASSAEAKEFPPLPSNRDHYKTVFVWKAADPRTKCLANPQPRVQILAMLRDDKSYWLQRAKGQRVAAEVLQAAQAKAIADYRQRIVGLKQCPRNAYLGLVQQSKDEIFKMFLMMFEHMMSPAGLPGPYADHAGAFASGIAVLIKKIEGK
jgi:hypothetical protein